MVRVRGGCRRPAWGFVAWGVLLVSSTALGQSAQRSAAESRIRPADARTVEKVRAQLRAQQPAPTPRRQAGLEALAPARTDRASRDLRAPVVTTVYDGFPTSAPLNDNLWSYFAAAYWALDDGQMAAGAELSGGAEITGFEFAIGLYADAPNDQLTPRVFVSFWNAPADPVADAADPVVDMQNPVASFEIDLGTYVVPAAGNYYVVSPLIDLAALNEEFILADSFYVEILPTKLHGGTTPVLDPNVFAVFSQGPIGVGVNQDRMWSDVFVYQNSCSTLVNGNHNGTFEHPAELHEGGCAGFEAQSPIRLIGTPLSNLTLEVPDGCLASPGDSLSIELWMRNLPQLVTGFQAFLEFDPAVLDYNGPTSAYTAAPFNLHIQPLATAEVAPGQLVVDGSAGFGSPGTSLDSLLATLRFDPLAECVVTSVGFRQTLFESEVSFEGDPLPTSTLETRDFYLDSAGPTLTCPSDLVVTCGASTDPLDTGAATAVDNCDATPVITYSDAHAPGGCVAEEVITRTWQAEDDCGNITTCAQLITVDDFTYPLITCPGDVAIECDASSDPSATGAASATDDCDTAPVIGYSDAETPGPCANEKTITRTWTATDACGNVASCDQAISVQDTVVPMITCPADVTVECDESLDPGNTGSPTASDNCSGAPALTYDDSDAPGACTGAHEITRTWTATDDCGHAVSCDQIITVHDTTAPQITCPADLAIECDEDESPANTGSATALDACDSTPVIGYSDAEAPGACPEEKTITRTWTATDACGNPSQCIQTIATEDTTAPTFATVPADISTNADAGECALTLTPAEIGAPTAIDNCDGSVDITFVRSDAAGNIDDPFLVQDSPITITWTATDGCGNFTQHVQTITVAALNNVDLEVELAGVHLPVTRCIHLVPDVCGDDIDVPLNFADHDNDDANHNGIIDATEGGGNLASTPVRFVGQITLECGVHVQLCAKDEQHTLWATTTLTDAGSNYTADTLLSLRGGDTDNDGDVDIHDVTWFILQLNQFAAAGGCGWNGTRDADFSNNGAVLSEDYTFLTSNWLNASACTCLLRDGLANPNVAGGRGRLAVALDLADPTLSSLRSADLNRDGRVDYRDVRLFETRNRLPRSLSVKMEISTAAAVKETTVPAADR